MFTGIVEDLGTVRNLNQRSDSLVLKLESRLPEGSIQLGDSVALDGACLTVSKIEGNWLIFEISHESIAATTLQWLKQEDRVHLERSLAFGARLGGHLVTGHVDGVGEVVHRKQRGPNLDLNIMAPQSMAVYLVSKSSVAVAGVSLTVNRPEGRRFSVTLVPHTLKQTSLGQRGPGDKLNLEADILGKYVRHFVSRSDQSGIDQAFLATHGFLNPAEATE